jgi:hypothetical protein
MTTMETRPATNGDRFGIKRELAIIPGWAYILAAVLFVGIPAYFLTVVWPSEPGQPGQFFRILFPFVPTTFFAFFVLMVGYVNRDAGTRGMNRTLWTLIAIFVPSGIGLILYFLLRTPIRTQCPKCSAVIDQSVNYCPHCRYSIHPTCTQCKSAVRQGDTFCANCGVQLETKWVP